MVLLVFRFIVLFSFLFKFFIFCLKFLIFEHF
jgi:hypothetical protein